MIYSILTRIIVKMECLSVIVQRGDTTVVLRNRLKAYRAALGVTQQELGHLAGVSRQTISLIERGDYSPSVTLALTLAKICQVRVEDIFILEEDNPDETR